KKAGGDAEQFGKQAPKGPATKAGAHRFHWDLRYPGAKVFDGMILWAARPESGPLAPPGDYQVRITANGQTQTQPLVIKKDPRLTHVTQSDLDEQWNLAMKVSARTTQANDMVIQIRALKAQIKDRIDKAKAAQITTLGDSVRKKLSAVEEELYQVKNKSGQD